MFQYKPAHFAGRHRTKDGLMTFDSSQRTFDAQGNHMGKPLGFRATSHDGKTYDSTGAFFVGELERLDQTLHMPLAAVSWGRDIDLRNDVTIADEVTSFTLSSFASAGGLGQGQGIGNGKAWIGKDTTQISGVGIDIAKLTFPLREWGLEVKYTIFEIESAAKIGRPLDQQKYEALKLKHQMDIDEQVYIGDLGTGDTGLLNTTYVTPTNVAVGAGSSTKWAQKTPNEILADVNAALTSVWSSSAWAVVPRRILIPPAQFGYISTALISTAGNMSILRYILENNLLTSSGVAQIEIYPVKWCIGAGVGGTIGQTGTVDRMAVYTKDEMRVRYPLVMLQRTPIQYDGIYHKCTYYGKLGVVEPVYPETIGFFDGI